MRNLALKIVSNQADIKNPMGSVEEGAVYKTSSSNDSELLLEANEDVIARMLPGCLPYVFLSIAVTTTTDYRRVHPLSFWLLLASCLTTVGIRVALSTRQWRVHMPSNGLLSCILSAAVGLPAATIGIFHATTLRFYGYESWPYVVTLLWVVGCASGATISFTPNFDLLKLYLLSVCTPVFVITIWCGGRYGYTVGLATVIVFIFLYAQGRALHNTYWKKMRSGALQSVRNHELEVDKATIELTNEIMKFKSSHDTLTGLWNRAGIVELLHEQLGRSQNNNSSVALFMVDIDHFKSINDTYGHLIGDQVLKHIAQTMLSSVRTNDWVGRYGGEEFLVIAVDCSLQSALALAERLREAVAANPVTVDKLKIPVTVSVGVAIAQDSGYQSVNLLKDADSAVYLAKGSGRNRVEVYKDLHGKVAGSLPIDKRGESPCEITQYRTTQAETEKSVVGWSAIELPPFSPVAIRALQIVDKGEVQLRQLAALLASDPAFSSELLRLANSALFGFERQIKSIQQALTLLGLSRVRALAITVGIRMFLSCSKNTRTLETCWRHSLACAVISEEIALTGRLSQESAYTGGIIHDIGRLALAIIYPDRYTRFLESEHADPESMLQQERELFVLDHCAVGGHLSREWNLPNEFVDFTARHHHRQEGGRFDTTALIQWSCAAAEAIGFGTSRKCLGQKSYEQLTYSLVQRTGITFYRDPSELSAKIDARIASVAPAMSAM